MPIGRSHAERSEATRAKLIGAARALFAERGYANVGTEDVVERAGVTRGALYHQFRDKRDLFRAVYSQVEEELVARLAQETAGFEDPLQGLRAGIRFFLDACIDPALMQIGLLDAPSVLGWKEWREIGAAHGLGLLTEGLEGAMAAGQLAPSDVRALAHVMLGALGEAAMFIASAEDRKAARAEMERVLFALLGGFGEAR
jgi:AcrR family transcriptional regulator